MSRFFAYCTYERALTFLLFLIIVLACGLTPIQSDTWWQLRAGADMWRSGHVLLTDTYSHTAYGSFWLNHEWLAELVYYGMYRIGGLPAVTLFAAALIVGGWAMTWLLTTGPVRAAFAWMLLALAPASLWWEPRPHAFSLLLLPASIYLLTRRRYFWLPPVFVLWANCHGGVLLGLVVLSAGLATQTLLAPKAWWKSALVFLGCVAATTATPLGLAFWTEIPKSLARIHQYPLDEWQRPQLMDLRVLPFWIIAAAFGAGLLARLRKVRDINATDAVIYVCAAILLPAAVLAIRNVGPFLMFAVPALSSLIPLRFAVRQRSSQQRPALNAAVMTFATLAVTAMLVFAYRNEIPRLRWRPVSDTAVAALRQCPGNLYNRYDEGGALLWFVPERKVFLDGRQDPFSEQLVHEHIRMETVGANFVDVFARHDIRCAYLPVTSPTVGRLVAAGWRTLHNDHRWLVLASN